MSANATNSVALVTGTSGYIGSYLARSLLADGWIVHALVRRSPDVKVPSGCINHIYDGSYESIRRAIAEAGSIDVVFHLASKVSANHTAADIPDMMAANIEFPVEILEAMKEAGVRNFVNTGTHWQNSSETGEYCPFSIYAATKQAFEQLAYWYTVKHGISVITLKLFDVYGPNDPRRKIVPLLIDAAISGGRLNMSPGRQLIDLVYVDDVVSAFKAAAAMLEPDSDPKFESYAVRSGRDCSLRDLVDVIEKVSGREIDVGWGELPYRPHEIMRPWAGREYVPGWRPVVGLEEGVARLCSSVGLDVSTQLI